MKFHHFNYIKDLENENVTDEFALSLNLSLNIQLGGDPNLSKDAMSEFYHNLSLQALSKSNHEILLCFSTT